MCQAIHLQHGLSTGGHASEDKNEDFIFILISKDIFYNKKYLGIDLDQEGAVGWPTLSSLS